MRPASIGQRMPLGVGRRVWIGQKPCEHTHGHRGRHLIVFGEGADARDEVMEHLVHQAAAEALDRGALRV